MDFNDVNQNPLIKNDGLFEIHKLVDETQVIVKTICADYFMDAPLQSKNTSISSSSANLLIQLIKNASSLGVTDIVIPCVDQSSLRTNDSIAKFIKKLIPIEEFAYKYDINLSLETDLPPLLFGELLDNFQSNKVTVNYDIGNSSALGFDFYEELRVYGSRISDIHIKDRVLGGGSVVLGSGNANFFAFFEALKKYSYEGPFIMQAYRDDQGIDIFKKQLDWVKQFIYE